MTIAIVTGASKGLGESVATFLLESKIHVFGVSRTNNETLSEVAEQNGVTYNFFETDLSDRVKVEATIEKMKYQLSLFENISQLYVVNNAAVVQPIKKSMHISPLELEKHFQINVLAPMMLLNEFLRYATNEQFQCIGINVTSGAADSAYYGWSAYCSSKASLNMYTKTVALEQEKLGNNHKVIAFSPGVMDTEMQGEIRATRYEHFIDVDTFKNYKQQNILSNTEVVASILTDIMTDVTNIQSGKIYRAYDYF